MEKATNTIVRNSIHQIPPSIYFGNAGCGAAFTIGVIHAMKETWGEDFYKKTLLCGDNTGAVLAMQLAMGLSTHHMEMVARSIFRRMRLDSHVLSGQNYWLNQYIDHVMSAKTELYTEFEGRFQCGTTTSGFTHQWHKKWSNNKDLGNCIKASGNIPLFCDLCELVDGQAVLDGSCSFAGQELPHGDETFFVGVNQSEHAEISYEMSFHRMCLPGDQNEFNFLFKEGYDTFKKWSTINLDTKWKKSKVFNIYPNYTVIILCWVGKYLQFFYEYVVHDILNE
jgi:hypothetical protein